jgi:hypothetical protein
MSGHAWLWPDHVIGKREARRLREEHNAAVNALDQERRLREQAEGLLVGAVSLGAERTRERDEAREGCALLCLDLIDDTEREHMIYTIPGYDLGSGLAKIACAEAIRKAKP